MAMATYLQSVSSDELAALEAKPETVNQLDQPVCCATHLACSMNYFLTGDAYPSPEDHALAALLFGARSVDAPTLENGAFGVVDPADVAALIKALEAVDFDALRDSIEDADLQELVEEEELYELEVMEPDEVPEQLVNDLQTVLEFYRNVAAENGAVVSYTT